MNRKLISIMGGAAVTIIAVAMFMFLRPEKPTLVDYAPIENEQAGYRPGGKECEPEELAKIRSRKVRIAKVGECQDKAEDYRLKKDNLIQQTSAARTAEQSIIYAHNANKTGLVQAILSFLAVAFTGYAAWASASAAKAARDSVQYISNVERSIIAHSIELDIERGVCKVLAVNSGRTPAEIVKCAISFANKFDEFRETNTVRVRTISLDRNVQFGLIEQGQQPTIAQAVLVDQIWITGGMIYRDIFDKCHFSGICGTYDAQTGFNTIERADFSEWELLLEKQRLKKT